MPIRGLAVLLFALAALLLSALSAQAAHADDAAYRYEFTPFIAYRSGGKITDADSDESFDLDESSAQGLILNIGANPKGQYELLYARQDTAIETLAGLDVEYLQFGGTYLFEGTVARPFIALTLGATRFDPAPSGFDSESFFSASFGGGLQLNAAKRIGLRLEARVYATFLSDNSKIFCASDSGGAGCAIEASGSSFTQWEARAGLVFRF